MSISDLMLLVNDDPGRTINKLIGSPESTDLSGQTLFGILRHNKRYMEKIMDKVIGNYTTREFASPLTNENSILLSLEMPIVITQVAFILENSYDKPGCIQGKLETDWGELSIYLAEQGSLNLDCDYVLKTSPVKGIVLPVEKIKISGYLEGDNAYVKGRVEITYASL